MVVRPDFDVFRIISSELLEDAEFTQLSEADKHIIITDAADFYR